MFETSLDLIERVRFATLRERRGSLDAHIFVSRAQIARDERDRFRRRYGEQCVEANTRDLRLRISRERLHSQRDLGIETGKLREGTQRVRTNRFLGIAHEIGKTAQNNLAMDATGRKCESANPAQGRRSVDGRAKGWLHL